MQAQKIITGTFSASGNKVYRYLKDTSEVFILFSAILETVDFFPSNFTQIESEPTENGDLSE